MRGPRCNFNVVADGDDWIVIKDMGPWDQFQTVTNSAEWVIEQLNKSHGELLSGGARVAYYDSDGVLDELLVENGRFSGFGFLDGVVTHNDLPARKG